MSERTKVTKATTQNLKNAVLAKPLTTLSEILTKSRSFRSLSWTSRRKGPICKKFHDSYKSSMFTLYKSEKTKKVQDILDDFFWTCYPFISEGRGFTNTLGPVKLSIKLLSHLLPEDIII